VNCSAWRCSGIEKYVKIGFLGTHAGLVIMLLFSLFSTGLL
jgi:hypothetical protein